MSTSSQKKYCGLDKRFHAGFINEIGNFQPVADEGAAFITNNSLCGGGLYVVGHSLGGAIAEIFLGCVDAAWNATTTGQSGNHTLPPVLGLYTFAAPGVSKDQLEDLSPAGTNRSRCFPGTRFFIMDATYGDTVPVAAYPFGFIHPKLKAVQLTEADYFWKRKPVYSKTEYACNSTDAKNNPDHFHLPSITYHRMAEHERRIKIMYPGDGTA